MLNANDAKTKGNFRLFLRNMVMSQHLVHIRTFRYLKCSCVPSLVGTQVQEECADKETNTKTEILCSTGRFWKWCLGCYSKNNNVSFVTIFFKVI